MAYSKVLVIVVEDDSRVSRLIRTHFEEAFPEIRVEIAGSAAKARMMCEKFKPTLVIWDGVPNERGTRQEYADCIPDDIWNRTICISADAECQAHARLKNARKIMPKDPEALNSWADDVATYVKSALRPRKGR